MALSWKLILLVASVVCFVVALLLALGAFSGGDTLAWAFGGALAFVLSFLVP